MRKEIHQKFSINGKKFSYAEWLQKKYDWQDFTEEYWQDFQQTLKEWFDCNEYIEIHTSGSTGISKKVRLSKKAMHQSAKSTALFFELKADSRVLLCLSTKYIAGKMMVIRAMVNGWNLIVRNATSNPLEKEKTMYDFVAMVPMQVENSLEKIELCKKIIIGGAAMSEKLRIKLEEKNIQAFETYGMTETATHIAVKTIKEKAYQILPHVKISIDERKCLEIENEYLPNKKIVTNDVVELLGEKTFLWKGRADFIINSGGIKINPERVEEKLSKKIEKRFFIAGIPDEKLGEKVVMIIEALPYTIDETIFEELQKYEKPKEVFFVSKFDETETQKIQRKEVLNKIKKEKVSK